MATTDAPSLTLLAARDVPGCMTLSAEAGWNQLPDDWTLFLDRGTVFGLLGADGRPAATGAILPYGDEFAWVSMVLVTAARRRHRIGTRILEACCKELTQRGLVAVLDATPAGEPVYRPLGFEPLFGLTRWQGARRRAQWNFGWRSADAGSGYRRCDRDRCRRVRRAAPVSAGRLFSSCAALGVCFRRWRGFRFGASRADRRTDRADCRRERSNGRSAARRGARYGQRPGLPRSLRSLEGTCARSSNIAGLLCNGRSCAWRCAMPLRSAIPRAHSWWLGRSSVERGAGISVGRFPPGSLRQDGVSPPRFQSPDTSSSRARRACRLKAPVDESDSGVVRREVGRGRRSRVSRNR